MHVTAERTISVKVTVMKDDNPDNYWFNQPDKIIATYDCTALAVDPRFSDRLWAADVPHPDALSEIEKLHPGCTFVYYKPLHMTRERLNEYRSPAYIARVEGRS